MHNYPLLRRVSELYCNVELGNVLLFACQHLLEPQKQMFEHLIYMGLKPENCVIVGKNYSTNDTVMRELLALGCLVAPFSNEFEPRQSFDVLFVEKLTNYINAEIAHRDMLSYDKILILDDGGYMHLIVNDLCPNLKNIIGVEQTSSGHHRIKAANIHFPFISVARSYHKLVYESLYIGKCGEWRILRYLQLNGKKSPRVLSIGLGPIGRQIAGRLLLINKFEGCVIDPRYDEIRRGKRDIASAGIFDLFRKEHILDSSELRSRISEFDLIIGNTGTNVLVDEDIDRLHPEATLISMSSSDREFPVLPFRKHGGNVHDNYTFKGRTLVNGGFPITFDGKRHGMPPWQIEFTISLLMIRLLHELSGHQLHVSHVVGQIHEIWQPDLEEDQWYQNQNSLD